jgi:hypothetical protein
MTQIPKFGDRKNVRRVGRLDMPGGGQVVVQGRYAYVGHMAPPAGTSIVDVADPRRPRLVSHLTIPPFMHSHKVRVRGDLMLVNYEDLRQPHPEFTPGLKLYDVSDKTTPREIAFHRTGGRGVHRFDVDDGYAYIATGLDGYADYIVQVVDLADPARPREVSRWWLPGQWTAGGEPRGPEMHGHYCHHPLRLGDRLYTGYWHAGFVILDVSDLARPRLVSRLDWSPPYPCPTHTALPIPHAIRGRRWLVVTDEEVKFRLAPRPNGFLWVVDITDETRPIPVATWRVPNDRPFDPDHWFGAHQPQEQVYPGDNRIFVTWFSAGLRAVDIGNPYAPAEIGHYVPHPGPGETRIHSNDVFLNRDGLIYLIDRFNGLDILEWTPGPGRGAPMAGRTAAKLKASRKPSPSAGRRRRSV